MLERTLNGLVFALVKNLDKFLNRLGRLVKVFSPLEKLIALLRETVVLLESLLVDVRKLLEAFIDIV